MARRNLAGPVARPCSCFPTVEMYSKGAAELSTVQGWLHCAAEHSAGVASLLLTSST